MVALLIGSPGFRLGRLVALRTSSTAPPTAMLQGPPRPQRTGRLHPPAPSARAGTRPSARRGLQYGQTPAGQPVVPPWRRPSRPPAARAGGEPRCVHLRQGISAPRTTSGTPMTRSAPSPFGPSVAARPSRSGGSAHQRPIAADAADQYISSRMALAAENALITWRDLLRVGSSSCVRWPVRRRSPYSSP